MRIYARFTDSTYRTMNSFVESFDSEEEFQQACEDMAGCYDGKEISFTEYHAARELED